MAIAIKTIPVLTGDVAERFIEIAGKRLRIYTIVVFSFIRTFAPSF